MARSCSSSLPRAPSALQHSREARGRVSAASLRPFTPNVAPVASEPPTPQQAPQPEPAQPPPPPALRAPGRKGKAPVRGKGAVVPRGAAREKGRAPVISSSAFPPLPAAPLAAAAIPASASASAAASAAAAGGTAVSPPAPAPSDEVSLTYDAVLKCYWDPAANIYYELNTINL